MKNLLIIDDDRDFSKELSGFLKGGAFDYKIVETTSFDDVAQKFDQKHPYDLILLDLCIAYTEDQREQLNENALRLLQELKCVEHENRPPVITFTVSSEIEQSAIASGADLCLRKPMGFRELSDIVQSILIKDDLKRQLRPFFVGHVFSPSEIDDLRNAISLACDKTPFSPYYADVDIQGGHILIDKIIDKIKQTEFGIYDISVPEKPNVFIELGVAIGLGKPNYLCARLGSRIPADLAGLDRIEYASFADLSKQVRAKIINARLP